MKMEMMNNAPGVVRVGGLWFVMTVKVPSVRAA